MNFLCLDKDKNKKEEIVIATITLDSAFENQVYNALIENGFEVDTQVGIGGYSIDLAIKKDGNYILGIECDAKNIKIEDLIEYDTIIYGGGLYAEIINGVILFEF